ncbi:MAG: MutS-related protein [Acidimicrobiales bacterium]
MKALLLYEDRDFDFGAELPPNCEDLIQDLELTTLLAAMALGDKFLFDVSRRVLLTSLDEPDAIAYRQRILADCIAEPDIIREMYAIAVDAVEDKRGLWGYSSQRPSSILSGAVSQLEACVVRLKELRKVADDHAYKFRSGGLATLYQSLQRELDDQYFQTISYHLKQLRFRDGELISAELDRDNSGINFVLRSAANAKPPWRERLGIGSRSSYSFTIPPRDEAGAQALSDLTSRGVNLVANAAAQSADHIVSYFTMLRAELGFYVSCLNLRDRLVAKGEPVSFPEPSPWPSVELTSAGLRDICLALRAENPVVGNDVDADGRSLVIVTGANSGGKSTFLRSVGLAQLMMQCGMFVAADAYRASVCDGVFTHFVREEDATMTSGRLDEELSRMSTIADQIRPHCLMLFNESFAATNEREGSEIGRQVVRALLEAEIKVFFVTHQFDFANSFHHLHTASTLFLRADREPDGHRSYKLAVAKPLPTSFGEDLYFRLGGWLDEDRSPGPAGIGETSRPPAPPADDSRSGIDVRSGAQVEDTR